ncbi:hypothetical protein B0T18DRAFT_25852 [Schizothecium vesticola]|uniref:Uncharacterized protein n=1 Tax=Schizothecium vesticola TaxID=314040 RepID=A0AA40F9Y2_9PEZI|nr:hypothetical protein B0T18DRAFT_25852 [Schizothecium vesticola]
MEGKVEKKPAPRPASSTELRADGRGVVECEEIFFMRIGVLRLTQRWVGVGVSASLTAVMAAVLVGRGRLFRVGLGDRVYHGIFDRRCMDGLDQYRSCL